jgi:aerobic-type carbon monoxide dehydrogenase small subunit (CoxS/CutS family)
MILAAEALLRRETSPTVEQIREALAGNLCRCTGYVKIIESVQAAAAGVVHDAVSSCSSAPARCACAQAGTR